MGHTKIDKIYIEARNSKATVTSKRLALLAADAYSLRAFKLEGLRE
jgi:hypothetical protein